MNNHRHLPDAITCTPPPAIVRRLFGWLLVLAAFFLWMLSPVPAHAQSADLPFAPDVNAAVLAVAVQADGKVLIGGDFTQVNGVARTYLARLHADGTLDTSFAPTLNQSPVLAIAALSDGKIMIGGDFTTVNGVARSRLAQLNADGSLATAFAPPSSHPAGNYAVHDIVPTPDGKFLVGRYTGIGRFNSDGSVDFFVETNATVASVLGLPDGRILAGGTFTTIGGVSQGKLARLLANGALDTAFQPNVNTNYVLDIVLTQDGGYLLAATGQFNGDWRDVMKFTDAGAPFPGFTPPWSGGSTRTVAELPDGRIMVGGPYYSNSTRKLWRLQANGVNDGAFAVAINENVYEFVVQADGSIVFGGNFTQVAGQTRNRVAKVSADGALEGDFSIAADDDVYALSVLPTRHIVVGGAFTQLGGQTHAALARITPTTTVDATFTPAVSGIVYSLLATPDDNLLIGGAFSTVNTAPRTNLARLLPGFGLDETFAPNPNGPVYSLLRQSDSRVLVAGDFTQVAGGALPRLVRLDANGALDPTFAPNPSAVVRTLAQQSDGKFMVGGAFTTIAGQPAGRLARLSADGAFDPSFSASATGGDVYAVLIQPDGKIVIGGAFTQVNGQPRPYLARLEANGALDASFAPATTLGGAVYALTLQPDGRLLAGGAFTSVTVDGALVARNRIARFAADGALDLNWNPNADGAVYAIALQSDGKVLIGGAFTTVGGQPHSRIARLSSDLIASQLLTVANDGDSVLWTQAGAGPELAAVHFYSSIDKTTYSALGDGVRVATGWTITDVALPLAQTVWIKAVGEYASGQSNGSTSAYDSVRVTNVRAADVTMTTQVVGGASQPGDWRFTVNGKQVAGNGVLRLDPGSYRVVYSGPENYTLTGVAGACSLASNVITLNAALGTNTCTLTFTRDTGTVTFVKTVEGGAAQPSAFSFAVLTRTIVHNGQTTLETGLYTVAESGPAGYVLRQATGACALVNGVIQLTVGKTGGTCNVVNTWPVTFNKIVEGGSAIAADWAFTVAGQTISPTRQLLLAPGVYPVTESGPARYSLVAAGGDCALVNGAAQLTVPATTGSAGACTLTNRRDTGSITFHAAVEGEGAVAANFTFTVIGQVANGDGGQMTLPTEDYTVSVAGPQGFITRLASGACTLVDGMIRLAVNKAGGECSIAMTRPIKFVSVVEGGSRNPASWSLRVGSEVVFHNRTLLLAPGVYAPTLQGGISTYTLVDARDACSLDAPGGIITLEAPGNGVCTLVNRRNTGAVTFTRIVQGGSAQPADWVTMVNGQSMPLGTPVALDTNTYTIIESGPPDYVVTAASGICTLDRGQIKLTVTEEGGECGLVSTRGIGPVGFVMYPGGGTAQADEWSFVINGQVVPHNGALLMPIGLYNVTVQGPVGYTVIGATGICSLTEEGDVQLSVGPEGGACNLQSAYDAGGQGAIGFFAVPSDSAPPEAWAFVVNGKEVDHNQTLLMPIGTYDVTVNGPTGYHVANAAGACVLADGAVRLTVTVFGGSCTVQTEPNTFESLPNSLFLPVIRQ